MAQGTETDKVVNWDYLVDVKSAPPSPPPWMVVTWELTPPLQAIPRGPHPLPAPLTLHSYSPSRDQPAQRVHSQGNEEGEHQVPQHDTRQHTRAYY